MGFVKTAAEVARIEQALAAPEFVGGERLTVRFRTDPAVLRRLLPPPLEPGREPVAVATVGHWQSSCVGAFSGGMLYLAARHAGVDGGYVLAMYMNSEAPIVFGRDLFGEPKKLAEARLSCDGDRVEGWVQRHGVRLIEVRADLREELGPATSERSTFNVKARSAAGGVGLEEDAILTHTQYRTSITTQRAGSGSVRLRSSTHDPLGEVPVLAVIDAVYARDDARAASAPVATIPAQAFLPYHLGRQDDWLALDTRPPAG